jgi:hypothetical protein
MRSNSPPDLPIFLAKHWNVGESARLRRRYRNSAGRGDFVSNSALDSWLQARQAESEQSAPFHASYAM